MQPAFSQVEVLPLTVKIHWPSAGCPQCAGECTLVGTELYMCESCGWVNTGLNKFVYGMARVLNTGLPIA